MSERIMIITTSGGGGLLQAAVIQEERLRKKDPKVAIFKRDIMKDWFGKRFGSMGTGWWNASQTKGNVFFQVLLLKGQFICEFLFVPKVFLKSFFLLKKENIDRVIDTQQMLTSTIIKSIRFYNWLYNKNVTYEKVMIDLPTHRAEHFFLPIRRCRKKERELIKFVTLFPLLKDGQTEKEFWQKYCKLSLKNVHYDSYMVRQSFIPFENKEPSKDVCEIKISFKSKEEKNTIEQVILKGFIQAKEKADHFIFSIDPKVKVVTALLGTYPSEKGLVEYMQSLVAFAKKSSEETIFFAYCSHFDSRKSTLFQDLCEKICKIKDYPKNLTIVPFSLQPQETIASLFYRSNTTISRAGGGTAMELMSVVKGDILIHSETYDKNASREKLLKGIPGHESGAAEYLEEKVKARVVNPELFLSYLKTSY